MENEATDAKCSIKSGKIVFGLNLEEKNLCKPLLQLVHTADTDKTKLSCVV